MDQLTVENSALKEELQHLQGQPVSLIISHSLCLPTLYMTPLEITFHYHPLQHLPTFPRRPKCQWKEAGCSCVNLLESL